MSIAALNPCLTNFSEKLHSVTGWRRLAIAWVAGGVMALAMPPFDCFPLLFVCFPALIFLVQGTTNASQAFATGWAFAFGFLVLSLYWIAASMFVDLARFWWAVPLAVAGLPGLFAIYYGIAAALARKIGVAGMGGKILFGLLWFLADYARGHLFTGFPWNLIGYSWSGVLPVLQITSVIGIYGLTLLTTVAACLPAALSDCSKSGENSKTVLAVCTAAFLPFVLFAIGGEIRLQITKVGEVADVHVRLVQPDIPQSMKWRNDQREKDFESLLDMTAARTDQQPNAIFWPETASTYYLSEDPMKRQDIAARIPASSDVITGVIRRELDEQGNTRFYNSMVVVDGLGHLVGGYDKSHLVPFGEFMPLRKYVPVKALAASESDFSSGTGARSLRVLGLPLFSPLICYEAIFPGAVVDENDRPDFIVNLTNDAWYGNTTGPYQHFAIVRVRAIEEGLPLIRVANTGISGVVDPVGKIVKRLGLGKRGFIDSELPTSLSPTLFSRWQEYPLWLMYCLLLLCVRIVKSSANIKWY